MAKQVKIRWCGVFRREHSRQLRKPVTIVFQGDTIQAAKNSIRAFICRCNDKNLVLEDQEIFDVWEEN